MQNPEYPESRIGTGRSCHRHASPDECRASELFLQQPGSEQRRLLQTVVEKAAWKDGALQTALFEPFEILRHSNQESYRKEKEKAGSGRELEIWLPSVESSHDLDRFFKYHNLLILQSR